jgi:hypothetical protein
MKLTSVLNPKILSAAAILMAAATAAHATGGTIYLEVGPNYGQQNPYQFGDGGEFTAVTTGLTVPLTPGTDAPDGYAADATYKVSGIPGFSGSVTGFETFCVEDQVDFYVGNTYSYTLGTPGIGAGAVIQQTGGSLTAGAAWLYEQFSIGKLQNFDYNLGNDPTDATARLDDAGLLQATLWALQGEPADSNVPLDPSTNPFLAEVTAHFGGSFAAAQVTANSSYGVSVLELTNSAGQIAQDQLIYWGPPANVPDNGATALLIGVSMIGLVAVSRRLRASASR